jgi:hypothetical protein
MKTPVLAPETHELLAELHPVGRMREIQDIVGAILFLENAAIITGGDCHSHLIRCTTADCSDFGNRSCRPTAVLMRTNGTMCCPSDVGRLADGNQVVR